MTEIQEFWVRQEKNPCFKLFLFHLNWGEKTLLIPEVRGDKNPGILASISHNFFFTTFNPFKLGETPSLYPSRPL